jgi:hypothetical protein
VLGDCVYDFDLDFGDGMSFYEMRWMYWLAYLIGWAMVMFVIFADWDGSLANWREVFEIE